MQAPSFKIIKKDSKTKARLGVLRTPHGMIQTPAYVFVGTYGRFLHLSPADLKKTKSQIFIANTFHLWKKAAASKLKEGFIHKSFGIKIPIMTDSGGFQVLSLAFGDKHKVGKFMTGEAIIDDSFRRTKIRITQKGVYFTYDGRKVFLGPKLSMKLQRRIGADIIFAFDHITSPLDDFAYNKKALELTNKWARICVAEHAKNQKNKRAKQMLFGIVQGGIYPELREQSSRYIGSLPFDGFGIGGSYTKKQISEILQWVIPHLPDEKPRHLLGVGKVADVFEAIDNGIDTFDCVIPTREARHGRLYTRSGHMDIRKGKYVGDSSVIEAGCRCPTCAKRVSRDTIRVLIKSEDRIRNARGQRFCLMHNMWFFNKLLADIRAAIKNETYDTFRHDVLKEFHSSKQS
ncbi:MAG TPA: tRNA guanosine(34) transglycosylase Tgt [Candidatus Paceibacterota bacterium]|nr:tRNA guanosine(34) transglycosylase Tgt [Candidatus Paceibacterota bacterium]